MVKDDTLIKKSAARITHTADELIGQLKSGLLKIGDIGISQKNKFINYVKEIFDVLPIIEDAGFKTLRVIVGISVPPSVEIHFRRFKEIDKSQINKIYEKYNNKMLKMILKPLLMANDFQGNFSTDNLIFCETCIEISIPPKVSIKYLNKDIAGLSKIEADFD